MNFKTKYRLLLYKAYFDKGFGLTNNLKYPIALFAAYDLVKFQSVKTTIIIGIVWVMLCFWIGFFWYRTEFIHAENEVNNKFNPFQIEVRKALKKRFK